MVDGAEARRAGVEAGAAQMADHGSLVPRAVAGKARVAGEKVEVGGGGGGGGGGAAAGGGGAGGAAARGGGAVGAAVGREARA